MGQQSTGTGSQDLPRPGASVTPTDGEHIRRAQAGDEVSFVVLYRAVHPGLVRYLTVLAGEEAEDLAAETWAQVCRDLGRFRGDMNGFQGWVVTIGRHRALDHLRRTRRRTISLMAPGDLPVTPTPTTEDLASESLGTQAAVRLIATLPPDQAEAVFLRAVLGLDARTAGSVLGKRPGAVRTAAHRGLRTLARLLQEASAGVSNGSSGTTHRSGCDTSGSVNADEVP